MSSETTFEIFNYLSVVVFATSRKNTANAAITLSKSELAALPQNGNSAFARKQALNAKIAFQSEEFKLYDSLSTEITYINALSDDNKQTLYDLYVLSGVSKSDWMVKMLFNTGKLLDFNASWNTIDPAPAVDQKVVAAKLIYDECLLNNASRAAQAILRQGYL